MSLKSQKSRLSKNQPKICIQCNINPVPYASDAFCSRRCEQLDYAPKAKALCQAEGISVRDLLRICDTRFQQTSWHRFLNGQLNDQMWYLMEAEFTSGLIDYWERAGLSDEQIDEKFAITDY